MILKLCIVLSFNPIAIGKFWQVSTKKKKKFQWQVKATVKFGPWQLKGSMCEGDERLNMSPSGDSLI